MNPEHICQQWTTILPTTAKQLFEIRIDKPNHRKVHVRTDERQNQNKNKSPVFL